MSSKFGGAFEAAVKLCAMFSVLLFALIGRLESGTWMQLDIYAHPWPKLEDLLWYLTSALVSRPPVIPSRRKAHTRARSTNSTEETFE